MSKNKLEHLAIIMDGNGRWAKQRSQPRTNGHTQGAKRVRDITQYCAKHDEIQTLTLYAFSTENWDRPKLEVDFLMKLLSKYLTDEAHAYIDNDIKFETIGDLSRFSVKLQKTISDLKEKTKNNTRLTQVLALNYGARDEIVRAVNSLIDSNKQITHETLGKALDTPYSDIDLMIRTSGEERISNFLLWQLSYSELHFTQTLWPDFFHSELETIIAKFKDTHRRFGT